MQCWGVLARASAIRLGQRILLVVLISFVAVYACDYLALRYRVSTHHDPFGTVNIRPYYAVPKKNGQTEFLFDDPQTEQCVHSLFPHLGDRPCWYASRHTERRIDI